MEICNEWSNELKTYRLIQTRVANSSTPITNKSWGFIIESICIFLNVDEDCSSQIKDKSDQICTMRTRIINSHK